ncbi:hypothetical protein ACGFOU_34440 [Streptomyces sp. NPDC048595]|uniref:hypothetical protein n=1 Tax=Streptomyces sp. NPDC048595 TaxID=3365576 RepID=UPI003713B4DC
MTLQRATHREGRHLKDIAPITGLYGAFEDIGPLQSHVVDSSTQSIAQTTTAIAAGLRTGRFTVGT